MINSFKNRYYFLSNFYPCYVEIDGRTYPSAENAFHAYKAKTSIGKDKYVENVDPNEAKKMGRAERIDVVEWDKHKDEYMYNVIKAKFTQNRVLKDRLIITGCDTLIEGNTWHDNYWGNCTCDRCKDIKGENHLGKILMQVRDEIK